MPANSSATPASRLDRIDACLRQEFVPQKLEIIDDSAKHHGHAGAKPEGETHYTVILVSPYFTGKTRVQRHRLVNEALKREFELGLHALHLKLNAPGE